MRAIGIILAGGNNKRMRELSNKRAIAAMPVAGSFRAIDFALSNMSNSHVQRVAVLTQYNSRSLNQHLSSSKWWDFGRKQGGLYVYTPTITAEHSDWFRGTADALYQNLDFLKQSHEPYVIIASGDGIYKLDYAKEIEVLIQCIKDERGRPDRRLRREADRDRREHHLLRYLHHPSSSADRAPREGTR